MGEDGQIVAADGEGANRAGQAAGEGQHREDEYRYDDDDGEHEEGEDGGEEGDGYVEEEEEEEEEFDYSTFQYRPYAQQFARDPDEPRVTIDTGPEGCSCFPPRSTRNIPSMLYDQVDCKHQVRRLLSRLTRSEIIYIV